MGFKACWRLGAGVLRAEQVPPSLLPQGLLRRDGGTPRKSLEGAVKGSQSLEKGVLGGKHGWVYPSRWKGWGPVEGMGPVPAHP